MVLGLLRLLMLIEHAGVEDGPDALIDEPLDVTVGQLGGVALGLRGDGLHALFVNFAGGERRQHHPEAQFLKEGGPEGVVFIHIQHSGNADGAPGGFVFFQRRVIEQPLALVQHQIGGLLPLVAATGTLFTAVAADVLSAAGELVDGEHTVVGAAAAAHGRCGVGQIQNVIQGQHGGFLPGVVAPGHQRRAKRAHEAGNVRAGGVHAGNFLKGPQHRLIVEGAALHHDVAAQILRGGQLDDLVQGVFDDGIGKARRDIGYRCALLLGLLDVGVHEHRAAGAQVHGGLGVQGLMGEFLGGKAQRTGEIFNKGTAAGGTGFI